MGASMACISGLKTTGWIPFKSLKVALTTATAPKGFPAPEVITAVELKRGFGAQYRRPENRDSARKELDAKS